MNNLAFILGVQGKLDEVASLRRQILEKQRQVLGDEHPATISAMGNLTNALSNQSKLNMAPSLRQQILEKQWQVLGDKHPATPK